MFHLGLKRQLGCSEFTKISKEKGVKTPTFFGAFYETKKNKEINQSSSKESKNGKFVHINAQDLNQDHDDSDSLLDWENERNFIIENLGKRKYEKDVSSGMEHCKCRNSKCQKLYCICFADGRLCTELCNCHDCLNNNKENLYENNLVKKALLVDKENQELNFFYNYRIQGCNCVNSNCVKNYCECFKFGKRCSEYCKCKNCFNLGSGDGDFDCEDSQ